MKEMYKGVVNSPETSITNDISASDTIIYVMDDSRLPTDIPNLLTIGTGLTAETVKLTEVNGTELTVVRGFQGTARAWPTGSIIARNFTEYDYGTLVDNVNEVSDEVGGFAGDIGALQTSVSDIATEVNGKVDKVAGKGLSTNDYTSGEKAKLEGVEPNANYMQLKNDMLTVSPGYALDARMGKTLKDLIDSAGSGVISVNNKTGAVTLTKSDVGLSQLTNDRQMPIDQGKIESYMEYMIDRGTSLTININMSRANSFFFNTNSASRRTVNFQSWLPQTATETQTVIVFVNMNIAAPITWNALILWDGGEPPELVSPGINVLYFTVPGNPGGGSDGVLLGGLIGVFQA